MISGPVTVAAGASLISDGSTTITGPVSATRPALFSLSGRDRLRTGDGDRRDRCGAIQNSMISGPLSATSNLGGVRIDNVTVSGPVTVNGNTGSQPVVVAKNIISGPLSCSGNNPAPGNEGRPNTVRGPASGSVRQVVVN